MRTVSAVCGAVVICAMALITSGCSGEGSTSEERTSQVTQQVEQVEQAQQGEPDTLQPDGSDLPVETPSTTVEAAPEPVLPAPVVGPVPDSRFAERYNTWAVWYIARTVLTSPLAGLGLSNTVSVPLLTLKNIDTAYGASAGETRRELETLLAPMTPQSLHLDMKLLQDKILQNQSVHQLSSFLWADQSAIFAEQFSSDYLVPSNLREVNRVAFGDEAQGLIDELNDQYNADGLYFTDAFEHVEDLRLLNLEAIHLEFAAAADAVEQGRFGLPTGDQWESQVLVYNQDVKKAQGEGYVAYTKYLESAGVDVMTIVPEEDLLTFVSSRLHDELKTLISEDAWQNTDELLLIPEFQARSGATDPESELVSDGESNQAFDEVFANFSNLDGGGSYWQVKPQHVAWKLSADTARILGHKKSAFVFSPKNRYAPTTNSGVVITTSWIQCYEHQTGPLATPSIVIFKDHETGVLLAAASVVEAGDRWIGNSGCAALTEDDG